MSDLPAMAFEAIKISLRQTKDGEIVAFVIHPNDMPEHLRAAPVGTRFQCAVVEIGDQEQPVDRGLSHIAHSADRLVDSAGALCRNEKFRRWLSSETLEVIDTEDEAAVALRSILGIASRSELKTNAEARDAFIELRDRFVSDMKAGK